MKKKILISIVVVLLLGAVGFLAWPDDVNKAEGVAVAIIGDAKTVSQVDIKTDDVVFALTAKEINVDFIARKSVGGKELNMGGGWAGDMKGEMTGQFVAGADLKTIKEIKLEINVAKIWSEHPVLTGALTTRGFFDVENHPKATFVTTKIAKGSKANPPKEGSPYTHTLTGNFKLNGIEKSITIPARIDVTKTKIVLLSEFVLDRNIFNVKFTKPFAIMPLTDENIFPEVTMIVKIDANTGQGQVAVVDNTNNTTQNNNTEAIDLATLPKEYVDTIKFSQIEFEMVLVPGDAANGIKPFYMSKYELTWDEFMPWAMIDDVPAETDKAKLRAKELRPSKPYEGVDHTFGTDEGMPALGMSFRSAKLYCAWLSKQTGGKYTYRVPTEEEWLHALKAGGNDPTKAPTKDVAEEIAIYKDNSWSDEADEGLGNYATRLVGEMEANKLGIYDLVGSLSEWVQIKDGTYVVRGGHFASPLDQLITHREAENQPIWNKTYPNEPKSIWWYKDSFWTGIRIICEANEEHTKLKK